MQKLVFFALTLFFLNNAQAAALFGGGKSINMDDGDSDSLGAFGSASSGSCSGVPSQAKEAYAKAAEFSKSCRYAKLLPGKKIAVNDYSSSTPTMYIFDQSGKCIDSMPIDWGRGPGDKRPNRSNSADRKVTSCATSGSHRNPAGMHMTTYHNGKNWPKDVALGLAGLSGQNSYGPPKNRAILIHPSRIGGSRRGAYTIGCTGVPQDKWRSVQKKLGYGSLVYNYYGDEGRKGAGCRDNAGQKLTCDGDPDMVTDRPGGSRINASAAPADRGSESGGSSSGRGRSSSDKTGDGSR